MGKIDIQYHDFENAKKGIKRFSEQTTTDLDLKRVDNSKGVGEFFGDVFFGRGFGLDHKVTGDELNELTSQIQMHFHSVNNTQIKLIREFGQVYSALEALDKDYIQAILVSIKETEETSQSIQKTQGQIKGIVENQRKTLEGLKKFKQKLDGYARLGDIDKNWSDFSKWRQEINTLSKLIDGDTKSSKESIKKTDAVRVALTAAETKIRDLSKRTNGLVEKMESVIVFTVALESVVHLKDIDEMWESLSVAQDSIRSLGGEVEAVQKTVSKKQEDINSLLIFMKNLSALNHLTDVDQIWERMEDHQITQGQIKEIVENHRKTLEGLKRFKQELDGYAHLEDIDKIWRDFSKWHQKINTLSRAIDSVTESNKECIKKTDTVRVALTAAETKIEGLSDKTNDLIGKMESVIAFTVAVGAVAHLKDIDEMWESLSAAQSSICSLSGEVGVVQKTVSKHQEGLNNLLIFVEKLSELKYLMEIDKIWQRMEEHQICIKKMKQNGIVHADKLNELMQKDDRIRRRIDSNAHDIDNLKEYKRKLECFSHLNDLDHMWQSVEEHTLQIAESGKRYENLATAIQNNKDKVDKKIAGTLQTTNATVEALTKKVKYACWIAGGAAGLAIIEGSLLLMKVI